MMSDTYHKKYVTPTYEADEKKREQMSFNNPFQAQILEGGCHLLPHLDTELVAILSSN